MGTATAMITECIICKKPLGADSKLEGFLFCHEHRKCVACNLELTSREAQWCYDKFKEESTEEDIEKIDFTKVEIYHARCFILRHSQSLVKLTQSEFDYLNLIRLMIEPDLDSDRLKNEKDADSASTKYIANMTYEQQQMCLSRMQACVAQIALALKLNPTKKKAELNAREKERFVKARSESLTSSRPVTKSSEDSEELQLGTFMEAHGLTERKTSMDLMRRRNREVKKLMGALMLSEKDAITYADKMFLEGKFYKK